MARQVLPVAFAVGFSLFGGSAQLGFALGSILGGVVDPQKIRTPGLKELPTMGVTEGAYRQVAYGTTVFRDCQLIDWGDIDVVEVETRQGKGGPVVVSERLYQTYAVGLGEPVQAIRYIKRNGVMVYDVRPGSTIIAESVEFAERMRFYDGSDTQLPDPDLEALPRNGVGNTPSYRGTSYFVMVRDDLTDLQGRIPTYEVEVVKAGAVATQLVSLVTNGRYYSGAPGSLDLSTDAIGWENDVTNVAVSPDGRFACGWVAGQIGGDLFEIRKFNVVTREWGPVANPAVYPEKSPLSCFWSPNGQYLAVSYALFPDSADNWIIYAQSGDSFTAVPPPAESLNFASGPMVWNDTSSMVAVIVDDGFGSFGLYDFNGLVLSNRRVAPTFSGGQVARLVDIRPGSDYVAVATDSSIKVVTTGSVPEEVASIAGVAGHALWWTADGNYLIGVGDDTGGDNDITVWEFDDTPGSEALTLVGVAATTTGTPTEASINPDRTFFAVARSTVSTLYPPQLFSISQASPPVITRLADPADIGQELFSVAWSGTPALPQYDSAGILLSEVVADICDRCSIPLDKVDLDELTDLVRGVTLGGNYDGAGAISTLMPAFLFDLFEAERKLFAPKRGGAVKATLTIDDLLEEPDENSLRGQGIEYPRVLQVKYLNPGQDYAAPAATVTNKTVSDRVRGEVSMDLPIAFDETGALNVAARALKVMWEDLNGEVMLSVPAGPFAWLTPTDCLGLVLRGATYRVRVEKVERTGGRLQLTVRRDRQSAYTSNLTAIPLPPPNPPPPSLAGATVFVPMNIPGRIDSDDQLGFVFGMTGLPGTAWQGANIGYRIAGGTDWISLGNFTTRAVMGSLVQPLAAASSYFTDTTNAITVALVGNDELQDITNLEFLSEGNPAAIVYPDGTAELLQFRDVDDQGGRLWRLSHLQRGRLATVPGPHAAAAQFVMLGGTQFVPLPSALIGQNLQFRVTSIGTSPETAPIYDFTWNPVHSQREFPPCYLSLGRDAGVLTASWSPRHRFGTDAIPVASENFRGFRVTATDGTSTTTTDSVFSEISLSDVFTGPVTVSVQQLNRFTGPGPATSEVIA